MKIAFLGLGRMGRELAAHLLADGHDMTVWNRTRSAVENLVKQGAKGAATPAEAVAGAEVVITVLFGPDTVREVVVDASLPIEDGAVWIDITSISPADADSFSTWAKSAGVRYAHSPVIGSLAPARARALAVLIGGDGVAVAAARPIVSTWAAKDRLREYDTAAKAAGAKLVANLALAVSMQGFVEALRLGHSSELTTDQVTQVLDMTVLSAIKGAKGENVRSGDFSETQFSAAALAKDTRLMVHTSQHPLPALTAVFQSLEAAIRAGRGEDDFSVIAADDREL
jgi:3-hydroxyisobutyrate dehydrogenase